MVFNARYLVWFDEILSAFLQHRGPRSTEMADHGIDFQLVRSEID
ncbi:MULTISPECIES: hypothetical protein [unclassified Streptomyces]|nr:hypothetical protein [Streptomyces sp. DH-12]